MTKQNWYNAERVSQPGSVILNEWRAQFQASSTMQRGLSGQEIANLLSGGMGSSGPIVDERTALRVSAVYAGIALLTGALSTIEMPVFQRGKGARERVDHPYYWILNEQANSEMSSAVFWEYFWTAKFMHGDAFAEIKRPSFRSSAVKELIPHHPFRVEPFREISTDKLFYRIFPIRGAPYVLHPEDVLHVPSLGFDGLRSPSPITYAARQSVETALSANEYNGRFFTNGARPDFAIKVPGSITKDQAELLRATWAENHRGVSRSHLPVVLTGGMEVHPLTLSPQDSQILAVLGWGTEEIARVLGVPPHMIGKTDKSTSFGTGVENMGRGFTKFTLKRDLTKSKQEINRKFWPLRERLYVDYDLTDIERGDLKSENESFRIALGRAGEPGWMTPNEVRHAKNMPPIEGGDTLNDGRGNAPAEAAVDPKAPPTPKENPDEQQADPTTSE